MECTIRLTAVTQKISTYASKISMGAVTESEEFIHYSLSVEKLLDWSQDDIITVSLFVNSSASKKLFWDVVISFHGVSSFPLPASSISTSLINCLHRLPFNSPQTIALNFFYSVDSYTCRSREQYYILVKTKQQLHLFQCNVSWLH